MHRGVAAPNRFCALRTHFGHDVAVYKNIKSSTSLSAKKKSSSVEEKQSPDFFFGIVDAPIAKIGPIEVADISGSGRGLMTTKAVQVGELLLLEGALALIQVEDEEETVEERGEDESQSSASDEDEDEEDPKDVSNQVRTTAGADAALSPNSSPSTAEDGSGGLLLTSAQTEAMAEQLLDVCEASTSGPRCWQVLSMLARSGSAAELPPLPLISASALGSDSSGENNTSSSTQSGSSERNGNNSSSSENGSRVEGSTKPHSEDASSSTGSRNGSSVGPSMRAGISNGGSSSTGRQSTIDSKLLNTAVRRLVFAADLEDEDVCLTRGQRAPDSVLGVWPTAALLNHSCAPNTSPVIFERLLMLRASRTVGRACELSHNYLGEAVLSPLAIRRSELSMNWGFECRCRRCVEEGNIDKSLQTLIMDISEAASGLGEDLERTLTAGRMGPVNGLRDQLAVYVELLDGAFSKVRIAPQTQIWLQASCFELYSLLHTCCDALGEVDTMLTELLQALVGEVAPGSEMHLHWALTHLWAVEEEEEAAGEGEVVRGAGSGGGFGRRRQSDAERYADQLCFKAYNARFGSISRPLYRQLVSTRKRLRFESS